MLYKREAGEIRYYDEASKFVMRTRNKRGFRQGCVMGMFMFCRSMEPVYTRLRAAMGENGAMYT
jgi:hypothetical protein